MKWSINYLILFATFFPQLSVIERHYMSGNPVRNSLKGSMKVATPLPEAMGAIDKECATSDSLQIRT
jgi:hypothetical protein